MCGIFIAINKKSRPLNLNKCKESLKIMDKRGPDWSFYITPKKNIFIGQAVLSMTGKIKKDISHHYSLSKNYFIVFNGEIYNYKDLNLLCLSKNTDKNIPDTKILVNLFDFKEKKEINHLLDGMYAYVIYDKKNNQLLLGRDVQGEKSLYIYENESQLIISSEINPIIHFSGDNEINPDTLKTYFYTRHLTQFEKTIFKKIKILEPGIIKSLNLHNFKFKTLDIKSFNNYVDEKEYARNLKRNESDLIDELDFLFKKNLKEMIPQNRKFASIVSGGIDSSLVSGYLNKISKPSLLISINHVGKDKLTKYTNNFNKYFNKKIYQHKVYEKNYYDFLTRGHNICQSPIHSHSFVGQLIVSSRVSLKKCRALFGGEGADELFGGYETYRQKIRNPSVNNSDYTKLIKPNIFSTNNNEFNYFKTQLSINWKKCLKSYSFLKREDQNRLSMMLMDTNIQLISNGLRGCDLMSMHYSVESRSVFLRKDIVNFALNLPLKFKVNLKQKNLVNTKVLLKKVFSKMYSKKLIYKKQGFSGFPNEMGNFLGSKDNFVIKDFLKINNFTDVVRKSDKATIWKIYNTELFLRQTLNLPIK